MSLNPKVSIVIPTYNRAGYVKEAMQSVLNQTFVDLELVIVDDTSTDQTTQAVEGFKDKRIRYHRNSENIGITKNWNKSVELARGEYIVVFHDDDLMLPENIARKTDILDKNTNVGMVCSSAQIIDGQGNISGFWDVHRGVEKNNIIENGYLCFKKLFLGVNFICAPSVMARKECFDRLGRFDVRLPFTSDWEMWMRICLFYDLAYIAEPLIKCRLHSTNVSNQYVGSGRELEQEYKAKLSVLRKHAYKIADYRIFKSQLRDIIAQIALNRAYRNYSNEIYPSARRYFIVGIKIQPALLRKKRAIIMAIKLILGAGLWNLFKKLKTR